MIPTRPLLKTDPETYRSGLLGLRSVCPYRYAQWLSEDAIDHEYRVITSVLPDSDEGYLTAHRTGIIGQVFRTEKPILAPDARTHPLYDPFDNAIDWELCFPVFEDREMAGVVNLEGSGHLKLGIEVWNPLCQVLEETTRCRPPSAPPSVNSVSLAKSRRVVIKAAGDQDGCSDIVEAARSIARGGESTLLVGHYPNLLRGRGPTMAEASELGLGVSYCVFGVEKRLDLLATGPRISEVLSKHLDWWETCSGRYEFVLLQDH